MSLNERTRLPKLIDDPTLDPAEHRLALKGLERINRWSLAEDILWNPIQGLALCPRQDRPQGDGPTRDRPLRVLDIACGAGDLAIGLWKRAKRSGFSIDIDGADISPVAVKSALGRVQDKKVDVRFFELDVLNEKIPSGYDVIMTSLFLHHLKKEDAVSILARMSEAAGEMILVNDLVRSRLGFVLAYVGPRILTRSCVVHNDALLSVRAAFQPEEIKNLAEEAGLSGFEISRHWPCRFLLKWKK